MGANTTKISLGQCYSSPIYSPTSKPTTLLVLTLSLHFPVPLQQIKRELLDSQQKVASLQELSAQLLVHTQARSQLQPSEQAQREAQGVERLEAREKVHVIGNRLRLLLREVSSDLDGLERRLETMGTLQVRQDPILFTSFTMLEPLQMALVTWSFSPMRAEK